MSTVRVLFLAANPKSTGHLALDEEMHAIQQRLRLSGAADRFELRAEWAVRAEELPAALLRHKPRIVHFSGHGSESGEILLADPSGHDIIPVPPDTLRRLFRILARDILCVVLNSCFSERQAIALAEVVPSAVGMGANVSDTAAIAFAAGFYEALAFGESLYNAFELGRTATELALQGHQSEFPRLVARTGVNPERLYLLSSSEPPPLAPTTTSQVQQVGNITINGQNNVVGIQQSGGPGHEPRQDQPRVSVEAGRAPTRASLRNLLPQILRTSTDFDAFCLDYFEAVYRRYSGSMTRTERESGRGRPSWCDRAVWGQRGRSWHSRGAPFHPRPR